MKEMRKYKLEVIGYKEHEYYFDTKEIALAFAQRVKEILPKASIYLFVAEERLKEYMLCKVIQQF